MSQDIINNRFLEESDIQDGGRRLPRNSTDKEMDKRELR